MSSRTDGIILKKTDWGEAGQLFSIYTRDFGKVELIGRGTKKIQSKLNSHLQFFAVIDLSFAKGKKIDQLIAVSIVKNFALLKGDLQKIILGLWVLEIVEKMTKTNHPDEKIFLLLQKYLTYLNTTRAESVEDYPALRTVFIIELMTELGYKPPQNIINDSRRLNSFLSQHLEQELEVEKFLSLIKTK